MIDLDSHAAASKVLVGVEMQTLFAASFWYLQVVQRKAGRSVLPRTRLPLSLAFKGLHSTVQKAVPRTAGKVKSKDHFEGRFPKDCSGCTDPER